MTEGFANVIIFTSVTSDLWNCSGSRIHLPKQTEGRGQQRTSLSAILLAFLASALLQLFASI